MRYLWLLALVAGCGQDWTESESSGLRLLDATRTSNLNGQHRLRFDVLDGETAFLVSVDPTSPQRAVFLEAKNPDQQTVFDIEPVSETGRRLTGGQFTLSTVSLNWPIREQDGALTTGQWHTDVGAINAEDQFDAGVNSIIRVAFKQDSDFTAGDVHARVVYVGSVGQDDEVVRATEAAVGQWQGLYANFGLDLTVRYDTNPTTDSVGAPGESSGALFQQLSSQSDVGEVTVVIAERIADNPGIQGFAGGVPGPILPSDRSVMVLSAIDNGGGDLQFSNAEIRLLAETMAHEVGHFIGLFHPVELTFDTWDALDDTPECSNQTACINVYSRNLMFPVPVCSGTTCTPQTEMTPAQRGVMHRSVWVN
ncbi:MAG: hypothetical protein ACJATT_002448 [Myxococcota bacterium]